MSDYVSDTWMERQRKTEKSLRELLGKPLIDFREQLHRVKAQCVDNDCEKVLTRPFNALPDNFDGIEGIWTVEGNVLELTYFENAMSPKEKFRPPPIIIESSEDEDDRYVRPCVLPCCNIHAVGAEPKAKKLERKPVKNVASRQRQRDIMRKLRGPRD